MESSSSYDSRSNKSSSSNKNNENKSKIYDKWTKFNEKRLYFLSIISCIITFIIVVIIIILSKMNGKKALNKGGLKIENHTSDIILKESLAIEDELKDIENREYDNSNKEMIFDRINLLNGKLNKFKISLNDKRFDYLSELFVQNVEKRIKKLERKWSPKVQTIKKLESDENEFYKTPSLQKNNLINLNNRLHQMRKPSSHKNIY